MVDFSMRDLMDALTKGPGDLMKNLESPGKTGRVGRYAYM